LKPGVSLNPKNKTRLRYQIRKWTERTQITKKSVFDRVPFHACSRYSLLVIGINFVQHIYFELYTEQKQNLINTIDAELKISLKKQDELEDKLNNQDSVKEKEKKAAQETIMKSKNFIQKHSKSSQEYQKVKSTVSVII
jgi:hypothetical protein